MCPKIAQNCQNYLLLSNMPRMVNINQLINEQKLSKTVKLSNIVNKSLKFSALLKLSKLFQLVKTFQTCQNFQGQKSLGSVFECACLSKSKSPRFLEVISQFLEVIS